MPKFSESRKLKIEDRVVTLADIRRLAKSVNEEYEQDRTAGRNTSIEFTARCRDDSVFESDNLDFFRMVHY